MEKVALTCIYMHWASKVALVVKSPSANAGDLRDTGSTPGRGSYILPCVKYIASEKQLYNTGSPGLCSVMIYRGGMVEGREAQEGGDICIVK